MSQKSAAMRLFLALPDDLADQRQVVARVVEQLEKRQSVRLELHDWSTWVTEQTGGERRPLLQMEPGDIFLGIVWLRFGTPGADPEAAEQVSSASEEDFELAYRSWASAPRAESLFFRCHQLPNNLAEINGEHLARVDRFFARFKEEKGPGSYGEYQTRQELAERLYSELGPIVERLAAPAATTRPARPASPSRSFLVGESIPEYARKMTPGKAYEVSFLAVDMVDFAQVAGQHPAESVETLQHAFKSLVLETAAGYGGELFSWDADHGEGLLMFWSKRSHDHAIITGLKVIHGLPVFNLDPLQNPLGLPLEIRTAAHDAVIVFQLPVSKISCPDLDFLLRLRREYTHPSELTVSRRLLDRADERLGARFKMKGRHEREPIFSCRLPATERHALRANLEEVCRKVKEQAASIKRRLLQPTAALETSAVEAISASVDETYALLNRACTLLRSVDKSWAKKTFGELAGLVRVLVREEGELWQVLRRAHVQHREAPELAQLLEAIVQATATQRSRPAVTLSKAEKALTARSRDESAAPPPPDEGIKKQISGFLKADPLDLETALTDLVLHEKNRVVSYLENQRADTDYPRFLDKLWESADLLLLDDLYSIRGHQRAHEAKFYDVLTSPPAVDGRFRVVRELLTEKQRPTEVLVGQRFQAHGLEVQNRDLQIVWRALVVGHPVIKIRNQAAVKMSHFSMWQTIAHPSVPIASLQVIGERVAKAESDDAKKIFFDCIRSRILGAVESFRDRDELAVITKLILLLLDFPFLVETGYFERFDDILEKFLDRSRQLRLEVDYFMSLRQRLESARRDPDAKTASRPPAGITKLPLTIQRRLAAEKHYVQWFVTHPDARIAGETLRHITLSNVERMLRLPEINGAVMATLLRKPELFTRSGALLAALNNPKCDVTFATRHLTSMARSRGGLQALEKLARNPSANPAVRSAAQRLVQHTKQRPAHS